MLSFFRRGGGIAQVIMVGVVGTIIVVFVSEFRQGGRAQSKVKLECAVKVLNYCVDQKEYGASLALTEPPGADPKWVRQQQLNRYVLEGLVERELLINDAKRLGIEVGDKAIDADLEKGRMHVSLPVADARVLSGRLGLCRLADSRTSQCVPGSDLGVRLLRVKSSKTDQFDYKVYERTIRITTNRGAKEFRAMQHRELIAERMRELVREPVRVAEDEAFRVYQREHNRARARVVQARREWFARYVVDLTDKQVADWAQGNEAQVKEIWEQQKDSFKAGCPLVREIFVALDEEAVGEAKESGKKKLEAAIKRIADKEDFARVARETSELESGPVGGLIGCFDPKRYGDEDGKKLSAALEGLKPGTATPVIDTSRGYFILKLEGHLEEAAREETGRRLIARQLATRFHADGLAKQFGDELLVKVKAGAALEQATEELVAKFLKAGGAAKPAPKPAAESSLATQALSCPKVEDTAPFTVVSNPLPNAAPSAAVALKLFELEPGAVLPAPVETMDGVAVAVLKDKTQAKRADFDKQKDELMARLRDMKADDALVAYVAGLRAAAGERLTVSQELLVENEKKNAPSDSDE